MRNRIIFGLIMIATAAGMLYLDWKMDGVLLQNFQQQREAGKIASPPVKGLVMGVIIGVLTVMALRETVRLAAFNEVRVLVVSGLIGSVSLATLPVWWQFIDPNLPAEGAVVLGLLSIVVLATFAEQMIRHRTVDALRQVACTFLTVMYLGVGAALILALRVDYGVPMFVLFLAAVKCTDMGAYFTGSAIGRHKMIPWLSPGKSWEGLAGGVASAIGVSILLAWAFKIPSLPPAKAAVFGLVIGPAGQFGDLCESLLKRSSGAKDSGSLLPDFGGILDIIDSPLLAGPVAYGLLRLLAII